MKTARVGARRRVVLTLIGLSLVSIGFYGVGAVQNHDTAFSYLLWNLCLAWLPFLLVLLLLRLLRRRLWSNWLCVTVTLFWLIFLPNSFYMISDFIHIQDIQRHDLLYDVVMFTSFVFSAALVGFVSLYLVHRLLLRRLSVHISAGLITLIIFLCSFAIYVGRDLRWNSWDVLLNPAGLLFDISDRLIHPLDSGAAVSTTASFFILLISLYTVGWQFMAAMRHPEVS